MKLLGQAVFLLLLVGIWCQNNRNAKSGAKPNKKSGGNQGGDVVQPSPVVDLTSGSSENTRGAGSSAEAERESTSGAQAAGQQTDDMRLHFLKNNQVTCNDGTAAG